MQFRSGRFLYMAYFSAIPIEKMLGFYTMGLLCSRFLQCYSKINQPLG